MREPLCKGTVSVANVFRAMHNPETKITVSGHVY